MWCKLDKTINNLCFNSHHPEHAETILKSSILRTYARSFTPSPHPQVSAFDIPSPLSEDVLYGRPLSPNILVFPQYFWQVYASESDEYPEFQSKCGLLVHWWPFLQLLQTCLFSHMIGRYSS